MFALLALLVAFTAGMIVGVRWFAPWLKWIHPVWARALFGAIALALGCGQLQPLAAQIQSVDTTWAYDSTAVLDSTRTIARIDTTWTVARIDSTWTAWAYDTASWHQDSTIASIDTTFVPPPPPPVLAGSCPNEPAGLRLVSDRHFATVAPDWVNVARFSQVADATAPDGDGWVGQQTYTTNNIVGSATMASYLNPNFQGKGVKTLYSCFWTKLDPGFTFSYPGGFFGTKQYWFLVGPSSGENKIFTNFYAPDPIGNGTGNGLTAPVCLGLVLQGVPSEPSHGTWCAKPAGLVTRGVWYRVEVLGQMNSTSTAADGFVRMWVNGAQVANRTNVRFTQVHGVPDLSHGPANLPWAGVTDPAEWFGTKWNNTLGGGSAFCTSTKPPQTTNPECYAPKTEWIRFDAQRVLAH